MGTAPTERECSCGERVALSAVRVACSMTAQAARGFGVERTRPCRRRDPASGPVGFAEIPRRCSWQANPRERRRAFHLCICKLLNIAFRMFRGAKLLLAWDRGDRMPRAPC